MSDADHKLFQVWCDMRLPAALRTRFERSVTEAGGVVAFADKTTASNLNVADRDNTAIDSDVAFGQPNPCDVIESTRLKWIHLNTAGYTRFDTDELRAALRRRGAILTNSSEVYSESCAQHLLAFVLAQARQLPSTLRAQHDRKWEYDVLRPQVRVLEDDSALIVGFGAIGARMAEILLMLRMKVSAVRRSPRGDEPVPTAPSEQLDALLPSADHVINTLPSAAYTAQTFNAVRFAKMRHGASFYNVGRGDTVDQDALRQALLSGQLSAAYLDVTVPEPLPEDHPLWATPNCFISPHIAGGMQDEQRRLVDHFLANLNRWKSGHTMLNRIV